MQALSRLHYGRLEQLVRAYQQCHAANFKHATRRNPRLGVDALCFRIFEDEELLGVLITPLSLSLACVSTDTAPGMSIPLEGATRIITLPSGRYRFVAESLTANEFLWRCELLDDLTDLEGAGEAARLAQRTIERVMAFEDETS